MKVLTPTTIIVLLLLAVSCTQPEQSPQQEELIKTVNVETTALQPESFERYIKLVGTVEAQNDIRVSAEVAGRIQEYFVEKGDPVMKGQAIAKIDDSRLIRERERLEAVTAQARENYQRLKRLYEEESIGSEIDYLNARYNYEQNKAALESIKVNLEKTTISSPFNATVEDVLVEAGEMVSPGVPMVRLIGSDRLKVSAGVPARFSDVVQKGDMAQVWFDFAGSDTLRLPITFVGQSIDPQARTFEVEIALPRENRNYKVDMITNVRIRTLAADDVLVVGEEFVYQKEKGYVVYIVGENEEGRPVAAERPVTLGASFENRVVVEDGIEAGDELITTGSSFLQDNMRINVVQKQSNEIARTN